MKKFLFINTRTDQQVPSRLRPFLENCDSHELSEIERIPANDQPWVILLALEAASQPTVLIEKLHSILAQRPTLFIGPPQIGLHFCDQLLKDSSIFLSEDVKESLLEYACEKLLSIHPAERLRSTRG